MSCRAQMRRPGGGGRIPSGAWVPYACIAAACAAVYGRTLSYGFTYLDDNALILRNVTFLTEGGLVPTVLRAFGQEVFQVLHGGGAYYRPMLTVSFILDARLGGEGPFVYHLTNVAIHLAASCLVFATLAKVGAGLRPTGASIPATAHAPGGWSGGAPFLLAVVFAVHPVLSQAVAWIPGRNDSLMALFALAAFACFADFLDRPGRRGGRVGRYLAHLVFFALAILTKETALMLPAVCGAYWKASASTVREGTGPRRLPGRGAATALLLGWAVVLGGWFLLRRAALADPVPVTWGGMAKSLTLNSPALLQLVGKIVLPFNLSVLPLVEDTGFGYGIAAMILLGICAAAVLRAGSKAATAPQQARERLRLASFGAVWFLLFLLPSFLRPNPHSPPDLLEHRAYLPIVGFLFLVSAGAGEPGGHGARGPGWRTAAWALIAGFAAITFVHVANFRDRMSFWTNAVRNSPHSPLAHRNLGVMHFLEGRLAEAESEYRKAISLNGSEPMAHNNLGLVYAMRGRFREAEAEFRKELAINPGYDDAYYNYGLLRSAEKRVEEAKDLWRRALAINPAHEGAKRALKAAASR